MNVNSTITSNNWEAAKIGEQASQQETWFLDASQYSSQVNHQSQDMGQMIAAQGGSIASIAGVKRPYADDADFEIAQPSKKRPYYSVIQSQVGHGNGTGIPVGNVATASIDLKHEMAAPSIRSRSVITTVPAVAATHAVGKPVTKALPEAYSISEQMQAHKEEPAKSPGSKSFSGVATADNPDNSSSDPKDISEALRILRDAGYNVEKKRSKTHAGPMASNRSELKVLCDKCGGFSGRPCEMKYVYTLNQTEID